MALLSVRLNGDKKNNSLLLISHKKKTVDCTS